MTQRLDVARLQRAPRDRRINYAQAYLQDRKQMWEVAWASAKDEASRMDMRDKAILQAHQKLIEALRSSIQEQDRLIQKLETGELDAKDKAAVVQFQVANQNERAAAAIRAAGARQTAGFRHSEQMFERRNQAQIEMQDRIDAARMERLETEEAGRDRRAEARAAGVGADAKPIPANSATRAASTMIERYGDINSMADADAVVKAAFRAYESAVSRDMSVGRDDASRRRDLQSIHQQLTRKLEGAGLDAEQASRLISQSLPETDARLLGAAPAAGVRAPAAAPVSTPEAAPAAVSAVPDEPDPSSVSVVDDRYFGTDFILGRRPGTAVPPEEAEVEPLEVVVEPPATGGTAGVAIPKSGPKTESREAYRTRADARRKELLDELKRLESKPPELTPRPSLREMAQREFRTGFGQMVPHKRPDHALDLSVDAYLKAAGRDISNMPQAEKEREITNVLATARATELQYYHQTPEKDRPALKKAITNPKFQDWFLKGGANLDSAAARPALLQLAGGDATKYREYLALYKLYRAQTANMDGAFAQTKVQAIGAWLSQASNGPREDVSNGVKEPSDKPDAEPKADVAAPATAPVTVGETVDQVLGADDDVEPVVPPASSSFPDDLFRSPPEEPFYPPVKEVLRTAKTPAEGIKKALALGYSGASVMRAANELGLVPPEKD